MPNWCYNSLIIEGDEDSLRSLIGMIKDGDSYDLTRVHPMPDEFLQERMCEETAKLCREKYGTDSWYAWALSNWGTKWPPQCSIVGDDVEIVTASGDAYCELHLESAWSPPIALIERLSVAYPSLRIFHSYSEEGNSFWGTHVWRSGDQLASEEVDESSFPEDVAIQLRSISDFADEFDGELDEADVWEMHQDINESIMDGCKERAYASAMMWPRAW